MYWIFKDGPYLSEDEETGTITVTLEQRQNFAGEKSDEVLLLDKGLEGWEFTAHFRISNVEVAELPNDYKKIVISLDQIEKFQVQKLLDDYIYSLIRVTNFAQP